MSIDLDIPIFKKTYDLYKTFHQLRDAVPKQDRYTLWQRCENLLLEVLEGILLASQMPKLNKVPVLEQASLKLNLLRVFVRLAKDVRAIDNKKYIAIESALDEIGRMLGGWIRSSRER
jgi:hypothetical protein